MINPALLKSLEKGAKGGYRKRKLYSAYIAGGVTGFFTFRYLGILFSDE